MTLEERVAQLESLAHPPARNVPDADDVEQELGVLRERVRRLEFITRLLPGNKGWPASRQSSEE